CQKEVVYIEHEPDQEEFDDTILEAGIIDTSNRVPTAAFSILNGWNTIYHSEELTFVSEAHDPEAQIDSLIWFVNGEELLGETITIESGEADSELTIVHRVVDVFGQSDEIAVTYDVEENPSILVRLVSFESSNTGDGNEKGELFFVSNAICHSEENDSCFTAAYPDVNSGATPFDLFSNQEVNFSEYSGLILFSGKVPNQLGISLISADWDDAPGGFLSLLNDIVSTIGSFIGEFLPIAEDVSDTVVEVSGHVQDYLEETTDHDVIDQLNILFLKENHWELETGLMNIPGPNGSSCKIMIEVVGD
ncbi:MAG: hypothetical protein KDC12_15195, partial [Flavobacteriales bacterium]|nr:hypothetical protein [Flavobacteriales bacterium]